MRCGSDSVTSFQQAVYRALSEIPAGRVSTYARLAARVGCRSARAVGQALRRNPFAPGVPCHRIIASDLTPGGFSGAAAGPEVVRKRALLATEGVVFGADGRLADAGRLHRFEDGAAEAGRAVAGSTSGRPKGNGAHRRSVNARRMRSSADQRP
jgi:methylated-DNA-[protein]-cysteine S-methyltransferase